MDSKMKKRPYYQANNTYIFNDDFLTTTCVEKNSIDLIVTSPPYNVDIRYNSFDDRIPYNVYLEFTQKWLRKAYKLLNGDGRFCLNIPLDKSKGGQQSVYADFVTIAKKIGFKYHSTIVWNEQNISRRTASSPRRPCRKHSQRYMKSPTGGAHVVRYSELI